MAVVDMDGMQKLLEDTALLLAAKKDRVTKGRLYLASLREEIRKLEKKSDITQDALAKTKYEAQELACRKAEKSARAVAVSSTSCENVTGLLPGAHFAAIVEKQEAKRLGAKCSRLLTRYKEVLAKVLSLEAEIQETRDKIDSELRTIAALKEEKELTEITMAALDKNLGALGRAFELTRVSVSKATELKSALLHFCEASRDFSFTAVSSCDCPPEVVVEWKTLPAVCEDPDVHGRSSEIDAANDALRAETEHLLKKALENWKLVTANDFPTSFDGEECYHQTAERILEDVEKGLQELESAEELFKGNMGDRLNALTTSVRSATTELQKSMDGEEPLVGEAVEHFQPGSLCHADQSQPVDFSRSNDRTLSKDAQS